MQRLKNRLRRAAAWVLAAAMTLTAAPVSVYADTGTGDTENAGSAGIEIQADGDDLSVLHVTATSSKETDQVFRLHLWEYDEGFFEDQGSEEKTPASGITAEGMEDGALPVEGSSGEDITLTLVEAEDGTDAYLEFTLASGEEEEFSITFAGTGTEDVQFIVEPEIVDASDGDTVSGPVALTVSGLSVEEAREAVIEARQEVAGESADDDAEAETASGDDTDSGTVGSSTLAAGDVLCGDNATWSVEECSAMYGTSGGVYYTLTISGTGAMYDYESTEELPWADYAGSIAEIVVEDGITYIGDNAFNGLGYTTQWGDTDFDSITIADSVTSIGENVLAGTDYINGTMTVPFAGRSASEDGGFEATWAYWFGHEAGTYGTVDVYHTYDGYDADSFDGTDEGCCSQTAWVYIESLAITAQTEFPDFAFSGIYTSGFTLPDDTTSLGNYLLYGDDTYVSGFTVPAHASLADHVFAGGYIDTLQFADGYDGADTLKRSMFDGSWVYYLYLPSSVTTIDGQGESGALLDDMSYLYITDPASYYAIDYVNGAENWYNSGTYLYLYDGSRYTYVSDFGSITVPEGTTRIGEGAFRGLTSLTSVDIPDSVTSIGDYTFYGCSSLTGAELPAVTSIGDYTFYGCSSLTGAELPAVTSIGDYAFYGCSSLTEIELPDGVDLGAYAFANCTSLGEVNGETTLKGAAEHFGVDESVFFNTALTAETGSYLDASFDVSLGGLTVNVSTAVSSRTDHDAYGGNGELLYYTGETATTVISVSNLTEEADGSVIRVSFTSTPEFSFGMDEGSFQFTVGGTTYTGTVTYSDGTYCMEIPAVAAGQTVSFSITSGFRSGTGGGLALVSVELEDGDGSTADSNGYQALFWDTRPDTYNVTKSLRDTWSIAGDGSGDGVAYLNGLSYTVASARQGDTLESVGSDPLASITYTDKLTLPEGWYVTEEIAEAIRDGNVTYSGNQVLYGDQVIFTLTGSSSITIQSMEISEDGNVLTAVWAVSGATSYSTVATYGDYMFRYDGSLSSGDNFTVSNQVDAAMHYTWSGVQTDSAETEDTVTVAEGSITLDKTFSGYPYYTGGSAAVFGQEAPFTLTLTNTGVASMALGDVIDTLPVTFYIPADGIEEMFASAYGEYLTITVSRAGITTGDNIREVTTANGNTATTTTATTWNGSARDGQYGPDTDAAYTAYGETDGATVTFTSGNGYIVMEYDGDRYLIGSGESADYDTVEAVLEAICFRNTYYTQYTVEWDFDSTDSTMAGGETRELDITSRAKTTFMMLTWDAIYGYGNTSSGSVISGLSSTNTAYLYEPGSRTVSRSSSVSSIRFYRDIYGVYIGYMVPMENGYDVDSSNRYTVITEGEEYSFIASFNTWGCSSTEVIPEVIHLEGSLLLEVPVSPNAQLADVSGAVENGDSYILTEGVYEDVTIATARTSYADNSAVADRVVVEDTDEGLVTTIYVYWDIFDRSSTSIRSNYFYYDTIYAPSYSEGVGGDSVSIVEYAGDFQGHRLLDSWGGVTYDISKYIVSGEGDKETEDTTSVVAEGDSVTYRLSIYSTDESEKTVTGAQMFDMLPLITDGLQWDTSNVTVSYSGFTSVSDTSGDAWYISGASGTGQQYLRWDDDFTVTFTDDPGYIWVTLTYPEGTDWEGYTAEYSTIQNTFEVDGPTNLTASVNHILQNDTEVLLQKGVYATGLIGDHLDSGYQYYRRLEADTGADSRTAYANGTAGSEAYVEYYVTLYNDGDSVLYLTDMTDLLPEGFTFFGFDYHAYDSSSGTYRCSVWYEGSTGTQTWYNGMSIYPNHSSITDMDGSAVFMSAAVTATPSDDGSSVDFSFSQTTRTATVSYDGSVGLCYLEPGEGIQFAYICLVDEYAETEDVATNSIAMPIYNRTGGDVSVGDSTVTAVDTGADANDGDCSLISNAEASAMGFTSEEADTQWVTSSVTMYRGAMEPGITKTLVSATNNTGTTEDPLYALPGDTLNWETVISNSGTNILTGYAITDELPYPYVFSGDVTYAITDSYGKTVAQPADGTLFTISGVSDAGDGTAASVTITDYSGSTHVVDVGESADIPVQWSCNYLTETSTGTVNVSFSYEEEGCLCMVLGLTDSASAIPAGCSGTLDYSTVNLPNVQENQTYVNTAYVTPLEQTWDGAVSAGNYTESLPVESLDGQPSVRNSAPVTVASGYATSSEKTVTQGDDTASSASGTNYIILDEGDNTFTYSLAVNNLSDYAMTKLVMIDNLPEAGDTFTSGTGKERGSEFPVYLAEKDADAITVDINGTEYHDGDSGISIQVSTKTEFTDDDWSGSDSADWTGWTEFCAGDGDLSGIRSIRVVLLDENGDAGLIPEGAVITVSFQAEADSEAQPGEYAWNSFGYLYNVTAGSADLKAAPLEVGVAVAGYPQITKNQVDPDGDAAIAEADTTYGFLIYEGRMLAGLADASTLEDAEALLAEAGRDYSYFTLTVKEGESVSNALSFEGISGISWTAGETYSVWEVPGEGYTFAEANGSSISTGSYSFTYTAAHNQALECVNELAYKVRDVSVYKYYDETVDGTQYTGSVEGAVLQLWNADQSEMLAELTTDENGYVTFEDLEPGDYVITEASAPEHFALAEDIAFTLDKDGSVTITSGAGEVQTDSDGNITITMQDPLGDSTVSITKKGSDGSLLSGVEYTVYKEADDGETSWDGRSWTELETLATGEDGVVTFDGLEPGTYMIAETKTLSGYSLLAEPIVVTLPLVLTADEAEAQGADTSDAVYDSGTDSWLFFSLGFEVTDDVQLTLPQAGGFTWPLLFTGLIGAAAILLGAALYYRRRRKAA